MEVTVTEYCDECKTLQSGVETREHTQYWPTVSLKLKCCAPCFDAARKRAIDEARAESNVYC
jgi:hypothetical protein